MTTVEKREKILLSHVKICYVAPDVPIPSPRGSSVHVTELSKSLSSLGHEIHVICRRTNHEEAKFEKLDGLILHRVYRFMVRPGSHVIGSAGYSASETRHGLGAFLYRVYLRTLFAFYISVFTAVVIRKYRLNAILERETSFGAGGLASFFTGKQLILEIIGPRYSRISVGRSKKILYYTDSMLRNWVDRRKCVKISGGVNLSLFREDQELRKCLREEHGYSSEQSVIGYVGTFQDWHGIDTLLYSIKKLGVVFPNIRGLLVGPYYERYQDLSKKLGLGETCLFTGPIAHDKIVCYINACDIMIALYEPAKNQLRSQYGIGSPLKILEYMACGKPVISTSVKPVDDLIQNGVSGYLVKPGDQEELILAISNLLADTSKIHVFGAIGKNKVFASFSWNSIAVQIEDLLRKP